MAINIGSVGKSVLGLLGGSNNTSTPPYAGSSIDSILAGLNQQPTKWDNIADLGSVAGAFSQGQKANRVTEGDFRQNYDQMMLNNEIQKNQLGIDAQTSRNQNEADALKKLQQASYIGGGGNAYTPPSFMLNGQMRTAPDLGFGPKASTAAEIQGANDLQGQVLNRLKPGGSFSPSFTYQPTPVDEYAKPGLAEQIGSYAGTGLGAIGALGNFFHPGSDDASSGDVGLGTLADLIPGTPQGTGQVIDTLSGLIPGASKASSGISGMMSHIPGAASIGGALGKAIPIAGAVTGGLGLIHDQGVGKNILNGATAGASIGSIVPGLGTAVGAGVGALAGGLRSLAHIGGPSQQELAGRDAVASTIGTITSGATPAQQAEAKASGWEHPEQALGLIVIRDKLKQQGADPNQANQLMSQLLNSTKGGPQATNSAAASILKALGQQNGY
jgi:hypothetical protein